MIPVTTDATVYRNAIMNADCDITIRKYKWGKLIRRDVIDSNTGLTIFSYVRDGRNQ